MEPDLSRRQNRRSVALVLALLPTGSKELKCSSDAVDSSRKQVHQHREGISRRDAYETIPRSEKDLRERAD
eukprot:scaffold227805_cov23-Tisochrysis_lutea.AAC.1